MTQDVYQQQIYWCSTCHTKMGSQLTHDTPLLFIEQFGVSEVLCLLLLLHLHFQLSPLLHRMVVETLGGGREIGSAFFSNNSNCHQLVGYFMG